VRHIQWRGNQGPPTAEWRRSRAGANRTHLSAPVLNLRDVQFPDCAARGGVGGRADQVAGQSGAADSGVAQVESRMQEDIPVGFRI
jgi:hypothetical protein